MGMDEIEANIPSHKTTDKEKFALYIDHMSEIEGRMTEFYSRRPGIPNCVGRQRLTASVLKVDW